MNTGLAIACLLFAGATVLLWRRSLALHRGSYIREYEFPPGLFEKLRAKHPELNLKQCQLVAQGLRQFFLAYLKSGCKFVSMPSQVADDLWHELILHTRTYQAFCQKAFGNFLHHTPAVVLGKSQDANAGLRRCFWFACREENINPRQARRLPLLFALDTKLNIPDGYHYVANCNSIRRTTADSGSGVSPYCGGDFASASIDGSTDGFGDGGGWGSDGDSSDSSGCGGGGCGGGD